VYNILKTLRFSAIITFVFIMIFFFAKYLLLPIVIFILTMKLLGYFKFKKIIKKKAKNPKKKHHDKSFIDAEYEELD